MDGLATSSRFLFFAASNAACLRDSKLRFASLQHRRGLLSVTGRRIESSLQALLLQPANFSLFDKVGLIPVSS